MKNWSVQYPLRRHKILWYLFLSIQTKEKRWNAHLQVVSHFYSLQTTSWFKAHGRWVHSTFQFILVFWPPTAISTKHIFAGTKQIHLLIFLKNQPINTLGGFYPPAFLPLVLGFVVTSVETVGDIQATCDVSGLPLEGPDADSRIQGGEKGRILEFSKGHGLDGDMLAVFFLELSGRWHFKNTVFWWFQFFVAGQIHQHWVTWGLLADGLNSILAVLMTSPPNTTFSQNNGVIAITRCASRAAGIACCIWLILSHRHCLVSRHFSLVVFCGQCSFFRVKRSSFLLGVLHQLFPSFSNTLSRINSLVKLW